MQWSYIFHMRMAVERSGAEQIYTINLKAGDQSIDAIARGSATVSIPYKPVDGVARAISGDAVASSAADQRIGRQEKRENGPLRSFSLFYHFE